MNEPQLVALIAGKIYANELLAQSRNGTSMNITETIDACVSDAIGIVSSVAHSYAEDEHLIHRSGIMGGFPVG